MGAHPGSSVDLLDVDNSLAIPLDQAMGSAPEPLHWVSRSCSVSVRPCPFLFKVLSAAQPLSIQVHPARGAGRAQLRGSKTPCLPWMSRAIVSRQESQTRNNRCIRPVLCLCGFRPWSEIRGRFLSDPSMGSTSRWHSGAYNHRSSTVE